MTSTGDTPLIPLREFEQVALTASHTRGEDPFIAAKVFHGSKLWVDPCVLAALASNLKGPGPIDPDTSR